MKSVLVDRVESQRCHHFNRRLVLYLWKVKFDVYTTFILLFYLLVLSVCSNV
jgi:hypothetical protein